jgi:hypothetical protein
MKPNLNDTYTWRLQDEGLFVASFVTEECIKWSWKLKLR